MCRLVRRKSLGNPLTGYNILIEENAVCRPLSASICTRTLYSIEQCFIRFLAVLHAVHEQHSS